MLLLDWLVSLINQKYDNMVRNVPDDPAQRKWYQSILTVIDNAITRLTGFLNKKVEPWYQ